MAEVEKLRTKHIEDTEIVAKKYFFSLITFR